MSGGAGDEAAGATRARRLATWLFEPPAAVVDPGARERLRVLSLALFPVLLFALGSAAVSSGSARWIYAAATVLVLLAWVLGRRGHLVVAGPLAVVACLATPYAGIGSEAVDTGVIAELSWLVLGLGVAGLTLPPRLLIPFGALNVGLLGLLMVRNPGISLGAAGQVVVFAGLLTALAIAWSVIHRDHDRALARRRRELERQRAFAEDVIASTADGLVVVDADDQIQVVNRALCNLVGREARALVGQPVHCLFSDGEGGSPSPALDRLAQPLPRRVVRVANLPLWTPDGAPVPAALTATSLGSEGDEAAGYVCVAHDLREMEALVRALAASQLSRRQVSSIEASLAAIAESTRQLAARLADEPDDHAATRALADQIHTGLQLCRAHLRDGGGDEPTAA